MAIARFNVYILFDYGQILSKSILFKLAPVYFGMVKEYLTD